MVLVIIERIKYNIFYETLTGGICMGSYLNPGNFSFRGSLRSKIYVDKSKLILLPVTTVVLAYCVNPLYAWVLIPIYMMISVVLPFVALKAGRGIGMRYRERLGVLKSKILESVYSIRDIQIFGERERRLTEVSEANDRVKRAALGLTLHRQTIASFLCGDVFPFFDL